MNSPAFSRARGKKEEDSSREMFTPDSNFVNVRSVSACRTPGHTWSRKHKRTSRVNFRQDSGTLDARLNEERRSFEH